jgi:hypothetical protein
MIEDFNEALWQKEHLSARRSERQMVNFRNTLAYCNLYDLGYKGTPWTYNNKKLGRDNVRVRLDRAVASPSWSKIFPQATVQHLVSSRSDHCPILLSMAKKEYRRKTHCLSRYEIMWEREESLSEEIQVAWSNHAPGKNLAEINEKLAATMTVLQSWSKEKFGSVNKELASLRKKLKQLTDCNTSSNQNEINLIQSRMDELLHREELMWMQRSRIKWLHEGDKKYKLLP